MTEQQATYQVTKTSSPVPAICAFAIAFALASNMAFRHHMDLMGQVLAVNTGIMLIVGLVSWLSLNDARLLSGQPGTPKAVHNYNRIAVLACRTLAFGLLSCFLFMAGAGLSSIGETPLDGLVFALALGVFALTLFTYLQGPREPFQH